MPKRPRTAPRKAPIQRRSQEMVETILRATARVLRREGYEATNTNRVAEAAGVSVGSVYQYFPSKESLVAALIERHSDAMWALFEGKAEALAEAPIALAARELVRAEIDAHAVDPKLHRVLIEQVPRVGNLEKVNDIVRRVTALVQAYLDRHKDEIRPTDTALAAFLVVSTVEAIAHAAVLEHPEHLANEALVDETTALVLRYLVRG
jgi:AcrR family transcriptional regulator